MTREQLMAPLQLALEDTHEWEPVPLIHAGRHQGTLIVKGMEVHFALVDRPTGSVRKSVRDMLGPVFDRYGMLTTKVPRGMTRARVFVQRLGFKPTWRDNAFEYFMLTALPWERKPKEA